MMATLHLCDPSRVAHCEQTAGEGCRLGAAVTVAEAQFELTLVTDHVRATIPGGGYGAGAAVRPLGDALRGRFRTAFLVFAGAVMVAVLDALVGIPLAVAATRALARLQSFGVPLLQAARVDSR
jgi:hypothetical protein